MVVGIIEEKSTKHNRQQSLEDLGDYHGIGDAQMMVFMGHVRHFLE